MRPLDISDLNTVYEYASDYETTQYMCFAYKETIQEAEEFLNRVASEWKKSEPNFYEFAIVLNGIHIGAVSVYYLDETREVGELGWILNKKYRKNGYALEAARAIKDFAFNTIHLKKIVAQCDYRNAPSARLMEKLGLKLESDNGTRFYPRRNETARELTYYLTAK